MANKERFQLLNYKYPNFFSGPALELLRVQNAGLPNMAQTIHNVVSLQLSSYNKSSSVLCCCCFFVFFLHFFNSEKQIKYNESEFISEQVGLKLICIICSIQDVASFCDSLKLLEKMQGTIDQPYFPNITRPTV